MMVLNPNATRHRVGVYGTLMQGERLHHVLKDGGAMKLGMATKSIPYKMFDTGYDFPALVRQGAKGMGYIRFEIYEVDNPLLRQLDYIEELYTKHVVDLGGAYGECLVYILSEEYSDLVDKWAPCNSGDWQAYYRAKKVRARLKRKTDEELKSEIAAYS